MPTIRLAVTPPQQQIVLSNNRYLALFAGRRWGKTITIDARLVYRAIARPGSRLWYVGPTYGHAFEEFRRIAFHPALQPWISETRQQPYPEIFLLNGTRIAFRSFDRPNNLRGAGLDDVFIDEIQDVNENDFWPVVRPLISDRRGTIFIAGQFRGHNWYYEKFYIPGQNHEAGYESWRYPSSSGVAFAGPAGRAELEDVKKQLPRVVYDQEYDCIPIANQAAVFAPADLAVIKRGASSGPELGRRYVLAVDIGRFVDPTAIVVLDDASRTVVHAEKLPLGQRYDLQAQRVGFVAQRYQAKVILDSTGGGAGGHAPVNAVVGEFRKVVPSLHEFKWTTDSKRQLIETLCVAIEQRSISVPAQYDEIHRELSWYEHKTQNGVTRFNAPEGKHDDYVAALAMAVWAQKVRLLGDPSLTRIPGF